VARPRQRRTEYPIPYVHVNHGAVVYRPWFPPDQREGIQTTTAGFLSPPVHLGKPGDPPEMIYQAWLAARESLRLQHTSTRHTLGWIMEQYFNSTQFQQLSKASQSNSRFMARLLEHPLRINGAEHTLAALHVRNLTQPLLHQIADRRLTEYQARGKKGTVQVNRETTLLSTALAWACNYIPDLSVTINPLRGFKKYPEQPVTRYVTDDEYRTQYDVAATAPSSAWLLPLFELTYLLATRGVETLDIRLSDCTEEGIRTRRRKGSRSNLIEWSDRLRAAYEAARALHIKDKQTISDPWLLCHKNGEKLSRSGVHSTMQRLKQRMKQDGLENVYWNLHALKAKGVSDSDDKRIAGHRTEQMRQRYDRSLPRHKPAR